MQPISINSDADQDAALREIERLWSAPEDTAEGVRLEALVELVVAYEDVHFPIDLPDSSK
jgi:HTH-type transcriptional regulator / antitoxin HigA